MSSLSKLGRAGLLLGIGMFAYVQAMKMEYINIQHTVLEKYFVIYCITTILCLAILYGFLALIWRFNKYVISRWSRTISDDEWIRYKALFFALFILAGQASLGFAWMGLSEDKHMWYSGIVHAQIFISSLTCCYLCSLFCMVFDHIHQISVKRNPEAYYDPFDFFNMIESVMSEVPPAKPGASLCEPLKAV